MPLMLKGAGVILAVLVVWLLLPTCSTTPGLPLTVTTITPTGAMTGLVYQSRRRHPEFRWSHVTRARAREAAETTTGQSFEAWFLDTHGGRYSSYYVPCPQVKVYSDSTNDTTVGSFYLNTPSIDTAMEKIAAPWHGLWSCAIGGFKVPT